MSLLEDGPPGPSPAVSSPSAVGDHRAEPPRPDSGGASPASPETRLRASRELLLVLVLFLAYKLGRMVATGHAATAFENADALWQLERALGVPDELLAQRALLTSDAVVRLANVYYAYVHFPATAAFLLWIYRYRTAFYLWARRALAALTAVALAVHLLFPLAPPRMLMITEMIDTGQRFGPAVYGPPETDTLSNQYAAMPSLHVGWALMVAIGLIAATATRWRWCWLLHPALTLFVVAGTANHYWLDAAVAAALLAAVLMVLARPRRPRIPSPHRGYSVRDTSNEEGCTW